MAASIVFTLYGIYFRTPPVPLLVTTREKEVFRSKNQTSGYRS
jgi:hypothetical protein